MLMDSFDRARAAYVHGAYVVAARMMRELAEAGLAEAQASLGFMYDVGKGVVQDHAEAVKWYRKAAEQNFTHAQLNLGWMYAEGEGVAKDYILAHMWLNLAAASGSGEAAGIRNEICEQMTPEEIAEAERIARDWMAGRS